MKQYQIVSVIIIAIFLTGLGIFITTAEITDTQQNQPQGNENATIVVEFFSSSGYCESCNDAKDRVNNDIIPIYGDNITIEYYPISSTLEEYKDNYERFKQYGFTKVPAIVVRNLTAGSEYDSFLEYSDIINIGNQTLEKTIERHLNGSYYEKPQTTNGASITLNTPFGKINTGELSLPILTVVLGAIDSVNPCSFFVLLFLLSILLYTKSRKRMILIGGIFIFFSGFIYFLLMTAILNFILFIEQQLIIAAIAGVVAIIFGILNIKDFFSKKGPSASIPDSKKPKLYKQMRKIVKITTIPSLIAATIVLAISANTVELLCSFNLPFIYTTVLSSISMSSMEYYLYILFYNVIYVIPLLIITSAMVITLGRWKLSESQGKLLKLFSGIMIFALGEILILNPMMLSSMFIAIGILLFSLLLTFIIYLLSKYFQKTPYDLNLD